MFFTALLANAVSRRPLKPDNLARGDYSFVRQHIAWLAGQAMKKHHVAGMSIALVDGDELVWTTGFGFADIREQVPATAETVYRVGSITKLFTASATMQLAEQGLLDIDQPLQRYLPGFSIKTRFADAPPVTLRHLLSHHAGLPTDRWKGMWASEPAPLEKLPDALKEEYVAYPPARIGSYSNLAYSLLGLAIQCVSGREYVRQVEASLLQPLGMDSAGFTLPPALREKLATGYRNSRPELQRPLRDTPAGGLYTNAPDLARFMQIFWNDGRCGDRQVLQPQTVAQMLRVQYPDIALDMGPRFGLGWALDGVDIHGGGPVAFHTGGTPLFHSTLMMLPEQRLGVVVLANSAEARGAVDQVAMETLKLALEAKAGIVQPRPSRVRPRPTRLSIEAAEAMAGTYATTLGMVRINNQGRRLRARHDGRHYTLIPRDDGTLEIVSRFLGVFLLRLPGLADVAILHRRIDGRELLVLREKGVEHLFGQKMPSQPIPPAWTARLGNYTVCNPDSLMPVEDVALQQVDDVLVLRLKLPLFSNKHYAIPLHALSDGEAISAGIGRGMGETLRVLNAADGERLRYSGYELRLTGLR